MPLFFRLGCTFYFTKKCPFTFAKKCTSKVTYYKYLDNDAEATDRDDDWGWDRQDDFGDPWDREDPASI